MKIIKRSGLLMFLLGLIMYLPPVAGWLTLQLGETAGNSLGTVLVVAGWSLLGAALAFSAGTRYQRRRIQ